MSHRNLFRLALCSSFFLAQSTSILAQDAQPPQGQPPSAPEAKESNPENTAVSAGAAENDASAEGAPSSPEEQTPASNAQKPSEAEVAAAQEPQVVEPSAEVPPEGTPPVSEPPALAGPNAPVVVEPPPARVVTPQQFDDEYDASLPLNESLIAQPDPKFQIGLGLDMSLPVGDAADFAKGFSFQGFSIDVRYLGFDEIQVGGMIAWHTMTDKLEDTVVEGPATLTGTMVRELSVTPMVAKVSYARLNKDGVVPYVSFGAGGARVLRRIDVGISRIVEENWQWAMIPELGAMLPVGPVMLLGALRYNVVIAGSGQPSTQYLNFVLGLGLK